MWQLIIDVKFFPMYFHAQARRHVAQTGTRGVYRKEGQQLTEGYYKPNPRLKHNTGAKGVHVLAGVGNGKVLLLDCIAVGLCYCRWPCKGPLCTPAGFGSVRPL